MSCSYSLALCDVMCVRCVHIYALKGCKGLLLLSHPLPRTAYILCCAHMKEISNNKLSHTLGWASSIRKHAKTFKLKQRSGQRLTQTIRYAYGLRVRTRWCRSNWQCVRCVLCVLYALYEIWMYRSSGGVSASRVQDKTGIRKWVANTQYTPPRRRHYCISVCFVLRVCAMPPIDPNDDQISSKHSIVRCTSSSCSSALSSGTIR